MCSVAVSQERPGDTGHTVKRDWSNFTNILKFFSQYQYTSEPWSFCWSLHTGPNPHLVHVCPALGHPEFHHVDSSSQLRVYCTENSERLRGANQTFSLSALPCYLYLTTPCSVREAYAPWVFSVPTQTLLRWYAGFWTSDQEVWQGKVREISFSTFVSPLFSQVKRTEKSVNAKWHNKMGV